MVFEVDLVCFSGLFDSFECEVQLLHVDSQHFDVNFGLAFVFFATRVDLQDFLCELLNDGALAAFLVLEDERGHFIEGVLEELDLVLQCLELLLFLGLSLDGSLDCS